ncbi:MAG: acetate--CoA ligase [Kiritimatiellae bacterium]|nr:acetate--CoA ligase [Kiritimatiellia bacterium]MCO5062035.1 acetate--CoA ligase [Kiritimatiellia bacterium]MCO5069274.1 acetate--CoA ligase [Kiritimatiellia bacterium]MCO6401640.1 acetate--CoA ligase [Verrucomicrobiota bacterium]
MSQIIDSYLQERRSFPPSAEFSRRAHISTLEEYQRLYRESVEKPDEFWMRMALENLHWFQKPTQTFVERFATVGERAEPYVEYFRGGKLNVSYNCLDRHVEGGRADKAALIWQGEKEDEKRSLTYGQLHREVSRFANVLKKHGVKKGTVVTIFMPMIPELPVALLACARIGALHSVVFSAFSPDSLKSRIQDCDSYMVLTSDVGFHAGKVVELKKKADQAVADCPTVKKILVYNRSDVAAPMQAGRDYWWHEELAAPDISDTCAAEPLDSEDPLLVLYTSGSTGKPKGVLHTLAGYLLFAQLTFKYIFDYHEDDIFWCTADVGWITGHSYLVYGPLSAGASCVMFEGVPTWPTPDRFWKIIQDQKVNIFYTAPTAIRALMRLGEEWPNKYDLSSLRVLGSVGEPINPEAWIWYHRVIGKERCPIVDTWWQTETGGIMISTLPGAMATKPGCAGLPFFGVQPLVLKDNGEEAGVDEGGALFIKHSWPGMLRGTYGDAKSELIKRTYFSRVPGMYFSGDGCRRDADGYYWLLGRIDDVLNVSGHRIATAELESALVANASVAEAAVVGYPHDTKGQGIYCFVTLKAGIEPSDELRKALVQTVRTQIGPTATPDKIQFADALPKTRSAKIMRRILRKIAEGQIDQIGDTSTLADPSVVESLLKTRQ